MDKHMKHANNTTNPCNTSSSGILRSAEWYSVTDVPRQLVGPIFKVQAVLYRHSGTTCRSQNVSNKPPFYNVQNSETVQISFTSWQKSEIMQILDMVRCSHHSEISF